MRTLIVFLFLSTFLLGNPIEQRYNHFVQSYNKHIKSLQAIKDTMENNTSKNISSNSIKDKNILLNNQINELRAIIKIEKDSLFYYKERLNQYYEKIIDSLENSKGDKTSVLNLLEKKILLNYQSFLPDYHWQNIKSLSIQNPNDSLEQAFFNDYLDKTETKIDSNLKEIHLHIHDIDEYNTLITKKNDFLDDINESQFLSFEHKEAVESKNEPTYEENGNRGEKTEYQTHSFSYIQTDPFHTAAQNNEQNRNHLINSKEREKYKEFLLDFEKLLKHYKAQIQQKRDSMK